MPKIEEKRPIRAWRTVDIGRDALASPRAADALFAETAAARQWHLARQLRQERRLGWQGRAGYDLARHLRLRRALSGA